MSSPNPPKQTVKPGRKVVITCAVTGAIHTPSMSPHLPITADEIHEAAIGAWKAGAAIVHLHARDPVNGKPEVASLNMGSMNFGLFPMLARFREFTHDWERPYLEGSVDRIFKNTFKDIESILTTCSANDTRFEIECYDIGHLYTLRHFADRGLVKPPYFIQSVFGILGGIGGHPEDVAHMKRTADRLFGNEYVWSVLGAGRNQLPIAAQSVALGGNVRVGLEDSLWIRQGELARTNAQQVTAARQVIEGLGLEVATPGEARALLRLKGRDQVNF